MHLLHTNYTLWINTYEHTLYLYDDTNLVLFFCFQGSEAAYIYGCIVLCFIPILACLMAYAVIKLMNSRRRRMKQIREENNNNGKKADKMHVKEWLHQNAKRPVKVKFGPDESFYLLNRKGDKLRTIPVKVSLFRACVHAILIGVRDYTIYYTKSSVWPNILWRTIILHGNFQQHIKNSLFNIF